MTSGASFSAGQLVTGALLKLDVFWPGMAAAFLMNIHPASSPSWAPCSFFPTDGQRHRLDIKGTVLISTAMVMVLYPLIQGRGAGWPLVFFVVLMAAIPVSWAFVKYEWS